MYLEHFGLRRLPFENTPDPAFFFMGSRYRDILALLMHGTVSRKGLMCITGPVGSGKTMLSVALAEHVPEQTRIIRISHPSAAREELLPFIADALEISLPGAGTLTLTEKIRENLIWLNEEGRQCLLMMDEAHLIRKEVFQEILVLSNLETPDFKLLQILLLGQRELVHTLAQPDMRQLMQRLAVSASLDPMNREQSLRYIAHRLKVADGSTDIFSPGVADALIRVSGGIPRNINKLCDASLLNAFVAGHPKVKEADFRKALENLGFHLSRSARVPAVPENAHSPVKPDFVRKGEGTGNQGTDSELTVPYSVREEKNQHAENDGDKASASYGSQPKISTVPDREKPEKKQTSPLFFRLVLSMALLLSIGVFFMSYRDRHEPAYRQQAAREIPSQLPESKKKKETLPLQRQDSSGFQKEAQTLPERSPAQQESTAMTLSEETKALETAPAAQETASLSVPDETSEKKKEEERETLLQSHAAEADFQSPPLQWDEKNINEEEESTDLEKYPYSVQLASFRTWERTEEAFAAYRKKGIPAYLVKMKADDGGFWFCIFTGIFEKRQDADMFISSRNAEGALAVRTPYAGLVKTFPSAAEASEYAASLAEKGYSFYVIAHNDGRHYLYAGAFRTPEGAEQQCSELISKNIDCRVAAR